MDCEEGALPHFAGHDDVGVEPDEEPGDRTFDPGRAVAERARALRAAVLDGGEDAGPGVAPEEDPRWDDDAEHGSEDEGCTWVGSRFGYSDDLVLTVDAELGEARATGTLEMYEGHGEEVVGRPELDVSWTGVGPAYREEGQYIDRSGTSVYVSDYSYGFRGAQMGGTLGPMGFDPELSGGWFGYFEETYLHGGL